MTFLGLLPAAPLFVCWLFVSAAEDAGTTGTNSTGTNSTGTNSTGTNSTPGGGSGKAPFGNLNVDSSMIQRALYVLIGITTIGVLYFLVRAVRLKKPGQKKKYGLLSNYDDSVEMDAMESDEDDTLYEARSLRR